MNISPSIQAKILQDLLKDGLIDAWDSSFIFYDLDLLNLWLNKVKEELPMAHHCVAIKTNPLVPVLKHIVQMGFRLEAASIEEVFLAMKAGQNPEHIVFDSPAKTEAELAWLKENAANIYINADSLKEAEEIASFFPNKPLGLRILFPGKGSKISSMQVGGARSKFGEWTIDIEAMAERIAEKDFIKGLHLHMGSQMDAFLPFYYSLNQLIDLAEKVNFISSENRIQTLDIGGGHPVNYEGNPLDFKAFADGLKVHCPRLFDYEVITEYGRLYHGHSGFSAGRIEQVKSNAGIQQVIQHLGADHMVRETYNPNDWYHEIQFTDAQGNLLKGEAQALDIGGPLCFGGDYLAKNRLLPIPEKGGWTLVSDTGANTFALWSRHCSRAFPKVIGKENGRYFVLKNREELDSILKFWS